MKKILYVVSLLSIGITHGSTMAISNNQIFIPNVSKSMSNENVRINNKIVNEEIPQNAVYNSDPVDISQYKNVKKLNNLNENNTIIETKKISKTEKISKTSIFTETTIYKTTKINPPNFSNLCNNFNDVKPFSNTDLYSSTNTTQPTTCTSNINMLQPHSIHSLSGFENSQNTNTMLTSFVSNPVINDENNIVLKNDPFNHNVASEIKQLWRDAPNVKKVLLDAIYNAEMFITLLGDNNDNWDKYGLFFRKAVHSLNSLIYKNKEELGSAKIIFDHDAIKQPIYIAPEITDRINTQYGEISEIIKRLARDFIVNEALTNSDQEIRKAISLFNQIMYNIAFMKENPGYRVKEDPSYRGSGGYKNSKKEYDLQVFIPSEVSDIRDFFNLDLLDFVSSDLLKWLKQSSEYQLLQKNLPIKTRDFGKNQYLLWAKLLPCISSNDQNINHLRDVIFNPSYPNISINIDLKNIYKDVTPQAIPDNMATIKSLFNTEFNKGFPDHYNIEISPSGNIVNITYSDINNKSNIYENVYSSILSTLMILLNNSNEKSKSDEIQDYILKILNFPKVVQKNNQLCKLIIPYYSDRVGMQRQSLLHNKSNYLDKLFDDISNDTLNIQVSNIMDLSTKSLKLLKNIWAHSTELKKISQPVEQTDREELDLFAAEGYYGNVNTIINQHKNDFYKILKIYTQLQTCLNQIQTDYKCYCNIKPSDSSKLVTRANELNQIITHLKNISSLTDNIGFNIVRNEINDSLIKNETTNGMISNFNTENHENFTHVIHENSTVDTTKYNNGYYIANVRRNVSKLYAETLLSIDNEIRGAINNTQELIDNLQDILFQIRTIQFINSSSNEKNYLKQKINNEISNFMKEPHTILSSDNNNLIINIKYKK